MAIDVKVLGPGCAKCKSLEKLTREVVEELQLDATVTKVEDIMDIMNYNVVATPAVVVNGKVVIKGRVPSKDELKKQVEDAANA